MIAAVEYVLRLPKWITYYFDSRRREYAADAYAVSIGLGRELREGLVALGLATEQIGMLKLVNYMIVKVRASSVVCLLPIRK